MDDATPTKLRPLADLPARATAYAGFMRGGALAPDAQTFLTQIFADIEAEDVDDLSAEDMLAAAHDFWTWTEKKPAAAQIVRVRPGQAAGQRLVRRDYLEVAGPDMPFLVRSIMGEITEQGLRALAMVHPIIETQRDANGVRGSG